MNAGHAAISQFIKEVFPMKPNRFLILSIVFLILAGAFSVLFWGDVSLVAKIGLFILGFGSGVTAGQWFTRRSQ
jgi:hypothetical protein